MSSMRPYLIRALYEWMSDNNLTPHLIVNAQWPGVVVPVQFVKEGKIILNIGPHAVQHLRLANDEVAFNARFGGVSMAIHVPPGAVLAIYAKETGEGMEFGEETGTPPPAGPAAQGSATPRPAKPSLKVVK